MNSFEQTRCPVCDRDDFTRWAGSKTQANYVCCRACGTLYANPRSPRNERHAWINDTFTTSKMWAEAMEARRPALALESAFIQQHITQGRILDIGCSTGLFFEFFPKSNWQYSGIELAPATAAFAQQTYHADVRVGMLREANFPNGYFDLVTLIDTICYIEDPFQDLCEARRILKDNGFLAIELPGQAYIMQRIRGLLPLLLNGHWTHVDPSSSYIFWPSPGSLALLLKRCGFEILDWHVIPSPKRASLGNFTSNSYFSILSFLSARSRSFLTWAPKYICIARAGRIQ